MGYVRALEEAQKVIHEANLRNAKLYGNCDLAGLSWTTSRRDYSRRSQPTVTENVIQSVIDTVTAQIAKNQPRAAFMTDGADWALQRRARLLEKFIEGEFHRTQIYRKARTIFRDACVFGLGALKIYECEGKIASERVIPEDLIVDDIACRSAPPMEIAQRLFLDKEQLKSLIEEEGWLTGEDLEKARTKIDGAHGTNESRRYTSWRRLEPHQVAVVESWRLPMGKHKGRHVVVMEGCTLLDEDWQYELPFVFFYYTQPLNGFYGEGLAHKLTGHQIRINQQNKVIELAQNRFAVPRVYVRRADAKLQANLTNEIGAISVYNDTPPIVETPRAINPELYADLERHKRSAHDFAGVSMLAAQAKKPAGLESAASLREYHEIETLRFSMQELDYEAFFLDAARMYVKWAAMIYKDTEYRTKWGQGSYVKKIPWADVDLDEDLYSMSIEAASLLARTPAGRKQAAIELAQAGLVSQDAAVRLLGHPDLEREISLATAALEYAEWWIEHTLDGGEYLPPEPYEHLQLAPGVPGPGVVRRQQAYLKARTEGAPDEILQVFRDWLTQASALIAPQPTPLPVAPNAPNEMGAQPATGPGLSAVPPVPAFAPQAMSLRPV